MKELEGLKVPERDEKPEDIKKLRGDIVPIYNNHMTDENLEGEAELLKFEQDGYQCKDFRMERWKVRFLKSNIERFVTIKVML